MPHKRKPTKLQRRTTELLATNPKLTPQKAMIKAGYSENTALNAKANFMDAPGTKTAMEEMKDKLADRGITIEFMAVKYQEWINANKWKGSMTEPDKIVPDYETQLKAKDDINRILGMGEEKPGINFNGPVQIVFKRSEK